ncbi:MAG: hypothetical protein U9Q90_10320 [Campylobacterota bacterium]|nr:hypothetical protein [Campylobacterota bacterium]
MINDIELSEIYDLEYATLLELREKHPKVYTALHDALKLKELRGILAVGATDTMIDESILEESDQTTIPDVHDRRSARR